MIKVYSTPTCSWCVKLKEYLNSKNIEYEDLDVASNSNAASEMVAKSGQRGVPVIDINGNIIIGYDKESIDKLLNI
jgi:glutaredoxin-like YruB-family protein